MKKYFDRYLLAAIFLALISFVVYVNYYDILIPGIPNGSYKLAVGNLFAIPSFILLAGQVFVGAFIIYACVYLFHGKEHATKSLLISSTMAFMFSLTYVIFPMFGPFYYIVFATGTAPPHVIEIELVWTILTLSISTFLVSRLGKVELRKAFFTALVVGIFIVVAAS